MLPSYYDYLWSAVLRIDAVAKYFELFQECRDPRENVVLKKALQLRPIVADAREKGTIFFQRMVSRILVTDESTEFKTLINDIEFDKVLRERSKLKKGRKKKEIISTRHVIPTKSSVNDTVTTSQIIPI